MLPVLTLWQRGLDLNVAGFEVIVRGALVFDCMTCFRDSVLLYVNVGQQNTSEHHIIQLILLLYFLDMLLPG